MADDCEIRPAATTRALVDGQWDCDDARDILEMAKDITTPNNVDGLFSRAEWVNLYGHLCDESVT